MDRGWNWGWVGPNWCGGRSWSRIDRRQRGFWSGRGYSHSWHIIGRGFVCCCNNWFRLSRGVINVARSGRSKLANICWRLCSVTRASLYRYILRLPFNRTHVPTLLLGCSIEVVIPVTSLDAGEFGPARQSSARAKSRCAAVVIPKMMVDRTSAKWVKGLERLLAIVSSY
jgi:hypothetical protein